MFIVPYGAPEGYEWFVTLVVLVGLYFQFHAGPALISRSP
jgi:hypothetical protein